MEQKRSYRRRGTPDLPMAVYLNDVQVAGANPIPEHHPEIELVRMIRGHVVIQVGGESKTFREGDIFLIPGNTVHNFRFFSEDVLYSSLIFSPDAIAMEPTHYFQVNFVTPLREGRLRLPQLLRPDHPAYQDMIDGLKRLEGIKFLSPDYQLQRFAGLMNICFILMPYCQLISQDRPPATPGNETVRQCMLYIHNHLSHKLTLEALGQHCHVHPNYLCALFKDYTGQTVFEYLTRYRIETAAQLLRNEELSAGKVAELVGFRSESLFFRKFKTITGLTPKAYAKQEKGK